MKYGEDYILIDKGGVFAGSWDQLADCFGIDEETIDQFCSDFKYTWIRKIYSSADELVNDLYKLNKGLIDTGNFEISENLLKIVEKFERNTY